MSNKKFGLICCSCVTFKHPQLDFIHYILTDILTKKPVQLTSEEYEDYDPADVIDAMLNTILPKDVVPSALCCVGSYKETDSAILLEMMPIPPCFNPMDGNIFACYVDYDDNNVRVFKDANTNKEIVLDGLETNLALKTGVDLFLSDDEFNSYNKISQNRVIAAARRIEYKDGKICIDVNDIYMFGDYGDVYNSMIDEFKEWIEKRSQNDK